MTELATPPTTEPFAQDQAAVVAAAGSDAENGLATAEAAQRLTQHGPNEITGEPPPSIWAIALAAAARADEHHARSRSRS